MFNKFFNNFTSFIIIFSSVFFLDNVNAQNFENSEIKTLFDFSQFKNIEAAPAYTYQPRYNYNQYVVYEDANEYEIKTSDIDRDDGILRIAVILPFEKQTAQVAEDLKNAASMALFDAKSDKTILQFYNSQGNYDSARDVAEIASDDGADIIIGPLFKEEVKGVKKAVDIPVISFTTDATVLTNNVFSIGFLMEQQIKRVVEYAISNGITKFAIIVSDSESGDFVKDRFEKYVSKLDGEIIVEAVYKNEKEDLMEAVKEVSDFDRRVEEYEDYKEAAKARFDYLNYLKIENPEEFVIAFDTEQYLSTDDEISALEKLLEELEKKTTINDPEFEAIFVFADDINDVIMIGSSLMYYDVHPDKIQYLGTSQLENQKVYNERAFRGAWYPSVSTKYSGQFDSAYKKYFSRNPIKIASLAYDAVSLINSLQEDGYIDEDVLLNPNGWTGINGTFRFNSNGSSERNMDVKEVIGGKITKSKVISPAPTDFTNN